jgi:hypothetical protein
MTTPLQAEQSICTGHGHLALDNPQTQSRYGSPAAGESMPPMDASCGAVEDSAALRAGLVRVRNAISRRAARPRLTVSRYYTYIGDSETDFVAFALAVEESLDVSIDEFLHTAEEVANARATGNDMSKLRANASSER